MQYAHLIAAKLLNISFGAAEVSSSVSCSLLLSEKVRETVVLITNHKYLQYGWSKPNHGNILRGFEHNKVKKGWHYLFNPVKNPLWLNASLPYWASTTLLPWLSILHAIVQLVLAEYFRGHYLYYLVNNT